MSAFTTSVPYSVKFESNASTSLSMDKQETHYDSKKEFGDSGSDLTAGFTSVKFVSGAQSYSADQASEINLSILSKGTDTISGPFSIPQTKLSTWTCNDKADAARGGSAPLVTVVASTTINMDVHPALPRGGQTRATGHNGTIKVLRTAA